MTVFYGPQSASRRQAIWQDPHSGMQSPGKLDPDIRSLISIIDGTRYD